MATAHYYSLEILGISFTQEEMILGDEMTTPEQLIEI
jgi:hypothetical protein